MAFKVEWHDSGREPQSAPDPDFPNGKHLVGPGADGARCCTVSLPYPAKRCGMYRVECSVCKVSVAITTAGRPDDPKSLRVACKETRQ